MCNKRKNKRKKKDFLSQFPKVELLNCHKDKMNRRMNEREGRKIE